MVERTAAGRGVGGRGVIDAAFGLLDRVGVMEPVRLVDLAEATGIPQPTVYRLLGQLIDVGAVRREGLRYSLGESLLGLGSRVTPERRLRVAARRPLAELAAVTGAAVALTAAIGSEPVFLATIDARVPLGFDPDLGSTVPGGTAQARAHAGIGHRYPMVDAGELVAGLSCVAVSLPLRSGQVAVVSTLVGAMCPPAALTMATRSTAARIAGLLHAPSAGEPMLFEKSSLSERLGAR
jgi:DNA-binding IclR family transcriptional regulator